MSAIRGGAVKGIDTAVDPAGDMPAFEMAGRSIAQRMGAIGTGVAEGMDVAVVAAHHQDALTGQLEGDIIAGVGNVAIMRGGMPGGKQNQVALDREAAGSA